MHCTPLSHLLNAYALSPVAKKKSLWSILHLPWCPDAFTLAVFFLGAIAAFSRCFSSCAFTKVGAFSHGLDLCTISCLCDVISFAAHGCVRGMPYFTRYDRPSNPCSFRCLTESCLKWAPHSRHVTVCLVGLFLQGIGFSGIFGVSTATRP
jgi:hypothetical protein